MAEKFLAAVRNLLEKRDKEQGRVTVARPHGDGDVCNVFGNHATDCTYTSLELPEAPTDVRLHTLPTEIRGYPKSSPVSPSTQGLPIDAASSPSENTPTNNSKPVLIIPDESDDDVIDLVDAGDNAHVSSIPQLQKPPHTTNIGTESTATRQTPKSLPHTGYNATIKRARTLYPKSTVASDKNCDEPTEKRSKPVGTKDKESRGVAFRPHPSKAVLDRLGRLGSRGRLFLVEKKENLDSFEFIIMGSNGNIYTCLVGVSPCCNCPDFTKRCDMNTRGPCKHLIFVFTRVLKIPEKDPRWWQVRLLPSEVRKMKEDAPRGSLSRELIAEEAVLRQFQEESSRDAEDTGRRRIGKECTICYEFTGEQLDCRGTEAVTICTKCQHSFHVECLQNKMRAKSDTTCPVCNTPVDEANGSGSNTSEYLNLAAFSTSHNTQLSLAEMYSNTHQFIGRGRRRRGALHSSSR